MSHKTLSSLAALLALGAACLGACSNPGPTLRLADGKMSAYKGNADVSHETSFLLELGDDYFKPTVLNGASGQRLALTLSNQGNKLHNFTLRSQHIDENVVTGTPVTVTVTFPVSGVVTFECRFHLLQNMRGELAAAPTASP